MCMCRGNGAGLRRWKNISIKLVGFKRAFQAYVSAYCIFSTVIGIRMVLNAPYRFLLHMLSRTF